MTANPSPLTRAATFLTARLLDDRPRHRFNHLVDKQMAQGIINFFKAIDVTKDKRQRP
jgi:hypothetical protein